MKISDYVVERLACEAEAERRRDEKNYYGADVCLDEFRARWEDCIDSLPMPVWEAMRRVSGRAIRLMWRVGYDEAVKEITRLASTEQDV